jgi:hypothetical protein
VRRDIAPANDQSFNINSEDIISGVNFRYLPNYQYIKILDLQVDGQPAIPVEYKRLFVRNTANLVARVVESVKQCPLGSRSDSLLERVAKDFWLLLDA